MEGLIMIADVAETEQTGESDDILTRDGIKRGAVKVIVNN